MNATAVPHDPVQLVEQLDPDAIAARLDELDREAAALRVLLRSTRARQAATSRRRTAGTVRQGAAHAG
jgi:hypothetical protein